jgi:Bacterial regulatory proteins, tetR family
LRIWASAVVAGQGLAKPTSLPATQCGDDRHEASILIEPAGWVRGPFRRGSGRGVNAAIAEFAERGFEGASIRAIADRRGLQHPLITYHYRGKDILWRADRTEWDSFTRRRSPICRQWRCCAKSTRFYSAIPSRFLKFIGSCARKP